MDIAVSCRSFLNKNYTGIGRYTFHLLKYLSRLDHNNRYFLYAKKGILNHNRNITNFGAKNFFVKNDYFKKGPDKTLGKVDIYHSPSPDRLNLKNGAKIVVTVHDLVFKMFPQSQTAQSVADTQQQFNEIVAQASRIICCSHNTAKDFHQCFNVPHEKVSVVYQGVDKEIFYQLNEKERLIAKKILKSKGVVEPFILCVGTIEPRKNLENIFRAFARLKSRNEFKGKLVVIGMKGWLSQGIEHLVDDLKLRDDILFMGFLTDAELRYFYNLTECLVFPSLYEGFGFPIVEAFCCGAAVVTSNVSSCPEVASNAGVCVDPYSVEAIASGVAEVVNDNFFRKELQRRALLRGMDFDFTKTASETLAVYKDAYLRG